MQKALPAISSLVCLRHSRANQNLSHDNDAFMFVTIFCGILNTKTGEIFYSNAGHNPPLIVRKENEAAYLETTQGTVIGVKENAEFQMKRLILNPEDKLFMYTDGVTEAMNQMDELFSEDRLQRAISINREVSLEGMVSGLMEEIKDFSNGVPQSDDIAILVLKYKGEKLG